jgi:hypothetical protein
MTLMGTSGFASANRCICRIAPVLTGQAELCW